MGLFSKKEKAKCPICGREMGLFSSLAVADGTICSDCEKMLRGKYNIEHWWEYRNNGTARQRSSDPLGAMTIGDIQNMIEETKALQEEAVAAYGGEYSSLLLIDDVFTIAPKPLDVGIKRAKAFKDKLVVRGMVQAGEFSKGDRVEIIHDGQRIEAELLDVIACSGAVDFDTELKANTGKKTAGSNTNAWMILSMPGAEIGDTIGKK